MPSATFIACASTFRCRRVWTTEAIMARDLECLLHGKPLQEFIQGSVSETFIETAQKYQTSQLIKSFMACGIYPPDATQIKREKLAPGVIFGEEEPMKNEAINSGIVEQKQRSDEATDIGLNESVKEKPAPDELTNQNVSTENIEPKEADETVKDDLSEFHLAEPLTPNVLKNITPRTKLTKAFLAHFRVNLRNSKAKSSRRITRPYGESLTEEESVKRLRMEEEAKQERKQKKDKLEKTKRTQKTQLKKRVSTQECQLSSEDEDKTKPNLPLLDDSSEDDYISKTKCYICYCIPPEVITCIFCGRIACMDCIPVRRLINDDEMFCTLCRDEIKVI